MSETTIRQGRREPFTVLYKSAIRDKRLTFEMLGFLVYMLDKPPDWEFTISGMARERGVSRDTVRRLVGRLEDAGYLLREQSHDENGHFAANTYVLQERPPLSGNSDNGEGEKPPLSENTDDGENRQRENPSTGFPPQTKNDKTKDYNNPPYNPPKGDSGEKTRRRGTKYAPDWKPERFAGFWTYYPRHENPQGAVRAWDKLKPSDELIDTIGRALVKLKATEEWQRSIGIPYAATFLNGERWRDAECERPAPQGAKGLPARRLDPPPDDGGGGWTWIE